MVNISNSVRDYGFAPGVTPQDRSGRLMLQRRPNTTLIYDDDIQNVQAFIHHLVAITPVGQSIGDLIIISHGDSAGWLQIDLDSTSLNDPVHDRTLAETTTYEVLQQAVRNGTVRIPDALHAAGPNAVQYDVHIRGCRIGQSPPFVEKLKEAFGRPHSVTAPKHFHGIGFIGSNSRRRPGSEYGSYEFLSYSFEIFLHPRDIFRDRTAARNAFKNRHDFRFIDGTEIPPSKWDAWIPNDPPAFANPDQIGRRYYTFRLPINLGQNIGRGLTTQLIQHEFRHEIQDFPYPIEQVTEDPGDDAAKEEKLRTSIEDDYRFASNHPFPFHRRFGYNNVGDFLDGLKWRCRWDPRGQVLRCKGTRRVYTVLAPVVDPATQNLFFNLFPVTRSGLVEHPHPDNALRPTDSRLFLTVS